MNSKKKPPSPTPYTRRLRPTRLSKDIPVLIFTPKRRHHNLDTNSEVPNPFTANRNLNRSTSLFHSAAAQPIEVEPEESLSQSIISVHSDNETSELERSILETEQTLIEFEREVNNIKPIETNFEPSAAFIPSLIPTEGVSRRKFYESLPGSFDEPSPTNLINLISRSHIYTPKFD